MQSETHIGPSLADTACVSRSKSDKSVFSPVSPAVLDFPVLTGHANEQHSVIEVLFAVGEDPVRVELPVRGINRHRNGLNGQCGSQPIAVASGDISEPSGLVLSLLEFAGGLPGHVGILSSCGNTIGYGELEAVIHPAPVAALVAIGRGTVHHLLLR